MTKHYYEELDDLQREYYITVADFTAQAGDGLSFSSDTIVEVTEYAPIEALIL